MKEIKKIETIKLLVLSGFGHVGVDYVGNLFDFNDEILKIPALGFFRKIKLLRRKNNIHIEKISNKKNLCKIILQYFFKESPIKSYNFFNNKTQKKNFEYYFIKYLNNTKEKIIEKKIFLAIHYSIAKIYRIKILNKKFILTQEDRPNHCSNYLKYFETKYIFVVRDPRATFAGSFRSQKRHGMIRSYGFDRVLGNWLTAVDFIKDLDKKKFYIIKNERFQGKKNLKREVNKLCKWIKIKYSKSLENPTYFGKKWHGDSSYLSKYESSKALPKNYYLPKNVKKRWKKSLSKQEILDIEMLLFNSMRNYGYKLENKITLLNLIRAYLNVFFSYKEKKNTISNIYFTLKNILRRIIILFNANIAARLVDLD